MVTQKLVARPVIGVNDGLGFTYAYVALFMKYST
jgi:hypothetical protein